MEIKNNILEQAKNEFEELQESASASLGVNDGKKLVLFLSFDICNSSLLKTKTDKWPLIVNALLKNENLQMAFWKFNGDEVVYKREIDSLEYMVKVIEDANRHINSLYTSMNKIYPEVYVKASLWIARTDKEIENSSSNYEIKINGNEEFVGKNIDEGFRLTKAALGKVVVIDPKIIYFILYAMLIISRDSETTEFENSESKFVKAVLEDFNLKNKGRINIDDLLEKTYFMGYDKFKGIWDNRIYPVFWYFDKDIKTSIPFDATLDGKRIWDIKDLDSLKLKNSIETIFAQLENMFKQVRNLEEVEEIADYLKFENKSIIRNSDFVNNPKIYYTIACVTSNSKKVLIAQRSETRRHLKEVWDLGSERHKNIDIKRAIQKSYKEIFGIDIDLKVDPDREDNLKPFGYCTIYRDDYAHISILGYASILDEGNKTDEQLCKEINKFIKDKGQYQLVRLVDEKDLSEFIPLTLEEIHDDSKLAKEGLSKKWGNNRCIMYFDDSIKGAIKAYGKDKILC